MARDIFFDTGFFKLIVIIVIVYRQLRTNWLKKKTEKDRSTLPLTAQSNVWSPAVIVYHEQTIMLQKAL